MAGLTHSLADAPHQKPLLVIDGLEKRYTVEGRDTVAIADVTFAVERGELVCIVGPSGCGKTTLLRCMSGLLTPSAGTAILNGVPITAPPKGLALVFQDYSASLMPWMTVRQNVLLPLRRQALTTDEKDRAVSESLESVGLEEFVDHYPWQLSGGMQQRVAIARAVAYAPDVLLMDEPFASVDAQTRAELEDLTLRLHADSGMTIVFVTHDIDEAVYLADHVVVLSSRPGRVRKVLEVGLARPRDQITTKADPLFASLRAEVLDMIKNPQLP